MANKTNIMANVKAIPWKCYSSGRLGILYIDINTNGNYIYFPTNGLSGFSEVRVSANIVGGSYYESHTFDGLISNINIPENAKGVVLDDNNKVIESYLYINGAWIINDLECSSNDKVLQFTISNIPTTTDLSTVDVSFAPLRYDKKFAFSFSSDDSLVGAYSYLYRFFNGKWIDDVQYYHKDMPFTTGFTPSGKLAYSDGAGMVIPYSASCSLWGYWGNTYAPNGFIREYSENSASPYITWDELRMMRDFGFGFSFHNVDERVYDKTSVPSVTEGLQTEYGRFYEKLGIYPKVMGQPDGNATYYDAGLESPFIDFIRSSTHSEMRLYPQDNTSMYKKTTYGGQRSTEQDVKLAEIAEQHASDNPYWVGTTIHTIDKSWITSFFTTLYNLYGCDVRDSTFSGDDSLLVTSLDDIYEYNELKISSSINKQITTDGKLVITVHVPFKNNYQHKKTTLLISNLNNDVVIELNSNSIYGYNFANHKYTWENKNGLILNLNFDKNLINLVEKYLDRFIYYHNEETSDDFFYFGYQLREDLAIPFFERYYAIVLNVYLNKIYINGGNVSTNSRDVTVTFDMIGTPTHYKLSESSDLNTVDWIEYTQDSIPFTLSDGNGQKVLYAKLKNDNNESITQSQSITLRESSDKLHSVVSLGWDYTGGSYDTNFDTTSGYTKVRINGDLSDAVLYDTIGNNIGSISYSGIANTGTGNQGNITGDNSGIYLDTSLKFSCTNLVSGTYRNGIITLSLPQGTYNISIFINTKNSNINLTNSSYEINNVTTQEFKQYDMTTYSVIDNFQQKLTQQITTTSDKQDIVQVVFKTDDLSNNGIFLNVIEIQEV